MMEARKSEWFQALFMRYNEWALIRKTFHQLLISGDVDPIDQRPALYVMNHSSWWDGLLVYHIVSKFSERDHYMMMDEQQLKKFQFFRKLGAFSVDKSNPRRVIPSLEYSAARLRQGAGVWIFPQGDIQHLEARPLKFYTGIGSIVRQVPETVVIPVTLYHHYGLHQKAEASMMFGNPLAEPWAELHRRQISLLLEQAVEAQLNEHRELAIRHVDGGLPGFRAAIRASGSVSETFERMFKGVAK